MAVSILRLLSFACAFTGGLSAPILSGVELSGEPALSGVPALAIVTRRSALRPADVWSCQCRRLEYVMLRRTK